MEGEATHLPEASLAPNPTPRRAENIFTFPLGDLTSDGDNVFTGGDGSSDHYDNYEVGVVSGEPQWPPFTNDFVLLPTPATGPSSIGELDLDMLTDYSFGNSGSLTPDQATNGGTSHSNSPPHRRWSNASKPLGVVQQPLGVQGVLMTTQIINIVEAALANKSQSLEMLLGTIQKAGVALNGLMGLHHHGKNQRCLMLFPVVLHQVADLMEAGVACLDSLNCQTVADTSGGATSSNNSILERLDSLNDLISSYHPPGAAPHRDEDRVRQWTRRLEEGLDSSLMTVGRLMELDRAACRARTGGGGGQHSYGHGQTRQTVGGCTHLEALAERFHNLRRRLSK